MNRDDIIRMAREAGLVLCGDGLFDAKPEELERFAALVAAATRESMKADGWRACAVGQSVTQHCGLLETAVLVEREACARDAERFLLMSSGAVWEPKHFCEGIAAAIRARGEE